MAKPLNQKSSELRENHKRSISVSLHLLDRGLCDWEQLMSCQVPSGVMYQPQDTLSAAATRVRPFLSMTSDEIFVGRKKEIDQLRQAYRERHHGIARRACRNRQDCFAHAKSSSREYRLENAFDRKLLELDRRIQNAAAIVVAP